MDYNLLKTFIKVSELGSFTRAAAVLNQPKSRVSRAISRLETELGVELIRRTTRSSTLTAMGEELYKKVTPHLNAISEELVAISNKHDEVEGSIKITASDSFAQTFLVRIISEYNKKYPKVKFEMVITNDLVDLIKENIDIAFRGGRLEDSTLIQKKLVPTKFILVCSSDYARRYSLPISLSDIKDHKYLSFKPMERVLKNEGVEFDSVLKTSSLPVLLQMARNGDGITTLPSFLCHGDLTRGKLVRVLPSWSSKGDHIHILYPPTKNQSKKVKEFIKISKLILS